MNNQQSKFIRVQGIMHCYELLHPERLSINRPLLVFLHEGLGSIAKWKDFPKLLSQKLRLPALVYDRYGHGHSEKLKSPRDVNFMHQQAQGFLPELFEKLNLEYHRKILIGHSDGGSIAIIHAGSFPEKISGIITIAAHLFLEEISLNGIRETAALFEKRIFREFLYRYHGENTDSMFHDWADVWLSPEFRQWNIEKFLAGIHVPFLALQGDNDQYGSYAQLQAIEKGAEKAHIEVIPNCGHIPHLQQKDIVFKIIYKFIAGII